MKSILVLSGLAFLFLQSCMIDIFDESIYGEGPVETKERKIGDFTGIKVSAGIDVFLTQDDNTKVEVVADENLHEVIKTEIRGNVLHVYSDVNIRRAKSKKVYVTCKKIEELGVSSAGDLTGQNKIVTDFLDISLSSAGDLDIEVEAQRIECSISSSGDARLSGSAEELYARLSSAGNLKAYELITKKCEVRVSSAGNAKIHVTEELDASASSAGDVYYMGDPKIKNISSSSSGGVYKR